MYLCIVCVPKWLKDHVFWVSATSARGGSWVDDKVAELFQELATFHGELEVLSEPPLQRVAHLIDPSAYQINMFMQQRVIGP